jgi:hypothetical protein
MQHLKIHMCNYVLTSGSEATAQFCKAMSLRPHQDIPLDAPGAERSEVPASAA